MEKFYKSIKEDPGYVKDIRSHALLNTDMSALHEYKQKRKQAKLITAMQEEINMLKEELEKIKTHLKIS
jgi:hypothetical protein